MIPRRPREPFGLQEPAKRFVVVTANDWGQGKTDTALDVATGLEERGYTVGGFCIRRVYAPTPNGFVPVALEALVLRTGASVRLARRDYTDDEPIDFRSGRREGLRVGMDGHFFLNRKAIEQLLAQALSDVGDPQVNAYIVDEVGPLLFKAKHVKRRKEKRSVPFYRLALNLVDHPKDVTVLVFSDPDMQAEESLGIRKHIQAHPSRLHDRVAYWRLTPENFRVLAAEILADIAVRPRQPY
jgi:nucleoside-triphosphatase THEP1